jgi:hypothetical protein
MLESPTINDSTDRKVGLAIDEDNQSDALELVFDYKVHGIDFKNTHTHIRACFIAWWP